MKDSYGREITYLRLSITELCNLRCRYCMPEEGICKKRHEDMLTEDEMVMAVETAASLGISKVRITGGEPMVKRNVLSICERVAHVPGIRQVCLTTNATLLKTHAARLREAGVDCLNISLDTLDPQKYTWITRCGNLQDALDGIDAALEAGFANIKLNAVLIGGFNEDEVEELAKLTLRWPVDVRFIELMPMSGSGGFGESAYLSNAHVLKMVPDLIPVDKDGGVARLYRLPGARGRVGLISPLSNHFCTSCNRIRLTADGKIKPCLHSGEEYPIKGLDREEMEEMMKSAICGKPKWHGVLSAGEVSRAKRQMNQIGG
ncbi:MAG: GTP 3',8-cyclase MoaA [Lachnospiraceae bacterium]|nr:GTP 3',8-cyclase MoaA [Lachnospiraceae bacterium]